MIVEGELLLERNLELEVERGMGTVSQGSFSFSGCCTNHVLWIAGIAF